MKPIRYLLGFALLITALYRPAFGQTTAQIAKLLANDAASGDYLGTSVSVSSDGSTAVVGAEGKNSSQGAAYVYTRSSSTWVQQAKLTAGDAASGDYFGTSVSLSSDGSTIVVGAYYKNSSQGAAYVYTRSGSTWTQQAKLTASDAAVNDLFGYSVSVSSDGSTAVVGAVRKNSDRGAAYVYARSGSIWAQQAQLTASDATSYDEFGFSVSVSGDGSTAIVGADRKNSFTGAAYVYIRSGSTWAQQAKLTATDAASNDEFGLSVSVSSDGSTAVVGADRKNSSQGAAYVYTQRGSTWTQQAKLTAGDAASFDFFGHSVSVSSDGRTAVVGAIGKNSGRGAAYVFTPGCTTVSLAQPATGQTLAASQTFSIASGSQTTFQSACSNAIGALQSTGTSPVSDSVTSKVWVETTSFSASSPVIRRHWEVTPASNAATATGRVTLYCSQADFDDFNTTATNKLPTSPNDLDGIGRLRVLKYSGTSSDGSGLPATYSGSSTELFVGQSGIVWNSSLSRWEISFDVTGFSGFFITSSNQIILPIKLTSFIATKEGSNGLLHWQVAGEENIAAYSIERSSDGRKFTTISSVVSLGNTTAARSYSFTDAATLKGANYYRIQTVEKDGKVSYSDIRLLNFGSQFIIALYPNPAKDKATLTGIEAGMQIRLLDAVGKVLQVQKATSATESILLNGFTKGMYSLQVYGTDGTLLNTARLVKE